jgi:hypothetical protein
MIPCFTEEALLASKEMRDTNADWQMIYYAIVKVMHFMQTRNNGDVIT